MSNEESVYGGDPSVLRRLNLEAVLRVLHAGGTHTITELAQRSRVSRPTAKQAVDDLVATGWAVTAPTRVQVAIGRPAQGFEFRPTAGHVLGADIGAHKILVLIADLRGQIVARSRKRAEPDWSPQHRLDVLDLAVEEALAALPPGTGPVQHATLTTPGTVDEGGTIVYNTVMPHWVGTNPAARLRRSHPDIEITTIDDTPMAALAEHWVGAARGIDDVFYLHLGRRPGAAVLIGGRPHLGYHRAAPQVGLWKATPWRSDYSSLLRLSDDSVDSGAPELFAAAAEGNADAIRRIETFAEEIVAGAIPFIIAVDPQVVVVGGGLSAAGEAIVGPVRACIAGETQFMPEVIASSLGDEAPALGAVRTALDAAEERLFGTLSAARRA